MAGAQSVTRRRRTPRSAAAVNGDRDAKSGRVTRARIRFPTCELDRFLLKVVRRTRRGRGTSNDHRALREGLRRRARGGSSTRHAGRGRWTSRQRAAFARLRDRTKARPSLRRRRRPRHAREHAPRRRESARGSRLSSAAQHGGAFAGRDFVTPDDAKAMAPAVLRHSRERGARDGERGPLPTTTSSAGVLERRCAGDGAVNGLLGKQEVVQRRLGRLSSPNGTLPESLRASFHQFRFLFS